MRQLRFALGQIAGRLGDTAGNMADACRLGREAARQGARLLLLPEGCLTGNALSDPRQQAVLPCEPEAFRDLSRVAREDGITICAGFATPLGAKFNVVQAVIEPSGAVLFQHKAFRAKTEPAFLQAWPDETRVPFTVTGVRLVIAICSEFGSGGIPAAVARVAPDAILHPSAGCMKPAKVWRDGEAPSPEARGFDAECRQIVEQAADACRIAGMPKMGSNPLGFDGETWWPGNSYAIDAAGRLVLWIKGENRPSRMQAACAVADLVL